MIASDWVRCRSSVVSNRAGSCLRPFSSGWFFAKFLEFLSRRSTVMYYVVKFFQVQGDPYAVGA